MTKVLESFNMSKEKPVESALLANCKLNVRQCPKSEKDKAKMRKVSYTLTVGSLMYAM